MTPYRLPSFWTRTRMLCENDGKRNGDTEWRIYYSDDVLPFSLLWQQILRWRSEWRLMFSVIMMLSVPPSLWCLTVSRHSERWQECLVGKRETKRWIGVKNLLCWWRLTAFLTMVIDPSRSFRMTSYRLSSPRQQILCCCFVWHLMEIICFGF